MPKKQQSHKIHIGRFCPECMSFDCEHTRGKRNSQLLTSRMVQILRLCGEGHAYKEIGFRLGIAANTVNVLVQQLAPRLGVCSSRFEVSRWAWEHADRLRAPIGDDVYMFQVGI